MLRVDIRAGHAPRDGLHVAVVAGDRDPRTAEYLGDHVIGQFVPRPEQLLQVPPDLELSGFGGEHVRGNRHEWLLAHRTGVLSAGTPEPDSDEAAAESFGDHPPDATTAGG